jgi:hypothetical protein
MAEGGLVGAGTGATFTALTFAHGSVGGPVGLTITLALDAAATTVLTVGGVVYGAAAAPAPEEVERRVAVFLAARADAGADLGLADELSRAVGAAGAPVLQDDGPSRDATLRVVLHDPVVLCDRGFHPSAVLRFEADAELRIGEAVPLPLGRFVYVSAARGFDAWTDSPSSIRDELRLGARQTAEAIADHALVLETKDGK